MTTESSNQLDILAVDDDPATLRLIEKMVASAGHQVMLAENGWEARETILQRLPDMVICDWDMPELDGPALCREIRARELPHYVYFLLLTGKTGADDLVEGLAAGADDFVSKPVHRAVLLARIEAGSRLIRMERQLRKLSHCDPLTGALNRRAFHQRFSQECERASRHGHPLSCAMIDLDFFKQINDKHGHAAGDATLVAVASVLEHQCRQSDVLCRHGGEEFCVLLPETNEAGAVEWGERARLAIARAAIQASNIPLHVTASLGVAQRQNDTQSPEQVMELADQALAVAKQSGRNRVVRFRSLNEPMPDLSDHAASNDPLKGTIASDAMSPAIFCPHQDDLVGGVAEVFLQLRLNSAPVVDEKGNVAGMVGEADLLTRSALGEGWEGRVRDVMRTDVVCYEEDTPLEEVYQFLSRVSVPRIVVVHGGKPTGVISRATLLRWFRNWMATREGDGQTRRPWLEDEQEQRRARIMETAEITAQRAVEMVRRIANENEDFVPCVVGEATKLQSLVNDLLGYCRTSHVP